MCMYISTYIVIYFYEVVEYSYLNMCVCVLRTVLNFSAPVPLSSVCAQVA